MTELNNNQAQTFEEFNKYPWDSDKVFQEGLESILNNLPTPSSEEKDADLLKDAQLLQAKHFYFTRFRQNFDLEEYLKYEADKIDSKNKSKYKENQEELFQRIQDYDYDNDANYTNGLPDIIRGWLEEQSKGGLWDKEKLDAEFAKAQAFYYNARVEKVDLVAYFTWKAEQDKANAPVCPFANLWQNKTKVGPSEQVSGSSFVVVEKPKRAGPETLTLSAPKSQNVFTVSRLEEYTEAFKDAQDDDNVTSILITATVADSKNPFEVAERIETQDTKVLSSGLAYDETSRIVSGADLRQISFEKLANEYYDTVRYIIAQRMDPKLAVTFSNGQVPLNAVYLILGLGFMRVITEHMLLNFKLSLSHAPIPPLLLLSMARARTNMSKPLPQGFELYLALSAPEYSKLRGPEILRLGLADMFVPEAKLSDAFDTAKKMAVCPAPDTKAALQLALAIHHAYSGPNRLQTWEDLVEKVFGAAESFDDLKKRLQEVDNTWSKNILAHWATLPPVLLNVIFRAVKAMDVMGPLDVLNLEQQLNAKWRQTDDYKEWLRSKNEWVSDSEQVDALTDFFFQELELPQISDEAVVYEAPIETQDDAPAVCPVTGQTSSTSAVCPVTGQSNSNDSSVCPVTGQTQPNEATCPVTGQKSAAATMESSGCPFSKSNGTSATDAASCPVSSKDSN